MNQKEKGIRSHIDEIENFWGIAKVGLYKFRGMDKELEKNPADFFLALKGM